MKLINNGPFCYIKKTHQLKKILKFKNILKKQIIQHLIFWRTMMYIIYIREMILWNAMDLWVQQFLLILWLSSRQETQ